MLYNLVMMFCFMQFIMVMVAAAIIVLSINIIGSIVVRMYSNIKSNNNVNMYYYKNRGRRGIVRVLGGRSHSNTCIACDTRAKRKARTALVRKQAWLVKHSAWLVQKNKMFAMTKRVRKQMRFAAMQYVQTSNIRRKHVVASRVYTNTMPKAAKVDYLSALRANKYLNNACVLATLTLKNRSYELTKQIRMDELAQRAALRSLWAGNSAAQAEFVFLRNEILSARQERSQIFEVLS